MMKWNLEWVDLQNIERMVSECWRLNPEQMERYYEDLEDQRELVFASDLGPAFLKILAGFCAGKPSCGWSDIQKDVRMIKQLIKRGQEWDESAWRNQYQELIESPEFFFYTRLGGAFTKRLADQLEVNASREQRLLRRDVLQIKKICDSCDFQKETDVRRLLAMLERNEGKVFESWLGEGFYRQLRERFLRPVQKPGEPKDGSGTEGQKKERRFFRKKKARKDKGKDSKGGTKPPRTRRRRMGRRAVAVFAGVSAVCMALWLYAQTEQSGNLAGLRQLLDWRTAPEDGSGASSGELGAPGGAGGGGASADSELDMIADLDEDSVDGSGTEDDSADEDSEPDRRTLAAMHANGSEPLDRTAQTGEESGEDLPEVLSKYQKLHEQYPDVFGWLKIPGMCIDYPVMQCRTDSYQYYYLHHDSTGAKDPEGSVFVDKESSCYPLDDNLVIYGHNMQNGHVFGTLTDYEDEDFYEEHQQIQFDTIYETGSYEVVAVVLTRVLYQDEEGFRYYQLFNYEDEDEFSECLAFIRENQMFDTGKDIRYGDRLLMLSTCEHSQTNGRLVVIAKRSE